MNNGTIRTALVVFGLASAPISSWAEPSFDLGKQEYEANCAICHGSNGKVVSNFSDILVLTVPDLTKLSANNGGEFPAARVYGVIDGRAELRRHGLRRMPIWGNYYSMMAVPEHDDYPHQPEAYVRSRIIALIDYLNRIQIR